MATTKPFGGLMEAPGRRPLVSFRAGKCIVNGTLVSPDTRRGLLQLVSGEDGLQRVQWRPRPSGPIEDDLIVIGDAHLERVPQCTTGRVYVLRFTSSDTKLLFWMQEPDASKDESLISTFNRHAGGSTSPSDAVPAEPTQPPQQNQQTQQEQLRQLLRSFAAQNSRRTQSSVSLVQVFGPEVVNTLSQDPQALAELRELMPEGLRTEAETKAALRCPQLVPALKCLTQAIYTDPTAVLSSMGASGVPAAANDPMEAFAEALENKFKESGTPKPAPAEDQNEDEGVQKMDEDGAPPKM